MSEQTPVPFDALGIGLKEIRSPSEMAQALGFAQIPGSRHSRDRDYTKDFPSTAPTVVPAEMTLYSGDFLNAQYEQVSVGVKFKEPGQVWSNGNWILENDFLMWFREHGGNRELAEAVRQLEEPDQKDRIRKNVMRQKGYSLVTRLIQQAEALGYFESLLNSLTTNYEQGRAFASEWLPRFLAEFPEYSLVGDRFLEEKYFYAARLFPKKAGRIPAMRVSIHPITNIVEGGVISFDIGTIAIGEGEILSRFHQVDNKRLPSTGEYPQTWFRGNMEEIFQQAVASRKQILEQLGR